MIYIHLAYYNSGESLIRDVILKNKSQLLKQGFLYPKTTLISDSHENTYYDLIGSIKYQPKAGNVNQLADSLLRYKLRKPKGKIIISSSKLIYAPLPKLFKLIGILSQVDNIKVCISITHPLHYLYYVWQLSNKIHNNDFKSWAAKCIQKDKFCVNFFKTFGKIEQLINKKNIIRLNASNLSSEEIVEKYFTAFMIRDRRSLKLLPYQKLTEQPNYKDLYPKLSELVEHKYAAANLLLYEKYTKR